MTLRRAEKRAIREAVNKVCAARVRTTGLSDIMENPTQEAMDYASNWRDTLAKGLAREPAVEEGGHE